MPFKEMMCYNYKTGTYQKRVRRVNDVGDKTTPWCALGYITDFGFALRYDASVGQAAEFAIRRRESFWHGGRGRGEMFKGIQYGNTRIDCSLERLLRILSNTTGTQITLEDLERSTTEIKARRLLVSRFKKGNRPFVQKCCKAHENYLTVMGYKPEFWNWLVSSGVRNRWLKVKRGKDLFVLEKFNIPEVVDTYVEVVLRDLVLPVERVLSLAYGGTSFIWGLLLNDKRYSLQFEYIKRWRKWFSKCPVPYQSRWDELLYIGSSSDFDFRLDLHPETMFRRLGEFSHQQEMELEFDGDPLEFEYQIPEEFGEYQYEDVKYSPIKTRLELCETAKTLHNCAHSYHLAIKNQECVLVKAEYKGGTVGLAEINLARLEIDQANGYCNGPLDHKTESGYNAYLENCKSKLVDSLT